MPMSQDKFYDLTGTVFQKCLEVMQAKGADYTHDDNKLANFERQASSMGLPPLVILRVYLQKHIDAFDAYVKTGKVESEPLEMRIVDIVNYFILALGQAVASGYEPQEDWLREALQRGEPDANKVLEFCPPTGQVPPDDPGPHSMAVTRGEKKDGDESFNACCNPAGEDCCDNGSEKEPAP